MRRSPVTPRKCSLTTFLVFSCIFLAPSVLKLLPHTDALVDATTWVAELLTQGLASFAFFMAVFATCGLASDAYRWLTGAAVEPTTPTPAQLEDGTAAATPSHELAVLEAEVAGAEPHAAPDSSSSTTETDPTQTQATTTGKILALIFGSVFFAYEVAQRGVVSSELPWWENLGAGLLFILRGFEVIFGLAVVLMFGVWVTRRATPGASAVAPLVPAEVLFEGTLPEEEQEETMPATDSEKA
ncbi:hypothetical protein B0H16DRAFT_1462601 [Mycena metata]|uniref:Uncharacterized protein n=1 Tax=Mycena metata TaxID=1033252 RepID=A0AAD7ILP2_9AGAR|nr:hypothetical protein B0H16DRAFT_1462601 [Mycena metata]